MSFTRKLTLKALIVFISLLSTPAWAGPFVTHPDRQDGWEYRLFSIMEIYVNRQMKIAGVEAKKMGQKSWGIPPISAVPWVSKLDIINGLTRDGWEPFMEYTGGDYLWLRRKR